MDANDREWREERRYEEWECGCRVWSLHTFIDGRLEQCLTLRSESCEEMEALGEHQDRAEIRLLRAQVLRRRHPNHRRDVLAVLKRPGR